MTHPIILCFFEQVFGLGLLDNRLPAGRAKRAPGRDRIDHDELRSAQDVEANPDLDHADPSLIVICK
jgi:hypothetical protein